MAEPPIPPVPPPGLPTSEAEPRTVSGYLAVALLLAMFAYGVFHVMRAHNSPPPFRMGPVEDQLQAIYEAAQSVFARTEMDSVTIRDLTEPMGPLSPIITIYGEDYGSLRIGRDDLAVTIQLPGGPQVTYAVTMAERDRLRARLRSPPPEP
ncbi:MAG: hypothetical protein JJT96_17860 [Opitutales bacterium]|nr:hypothetical protein [Opitutales bacterium]